MKEQFVTYEIALKLKELGFNEECFGYYCYYTQNVVIPDQLDASNRACIAPLWQQVIDWIREKHELIITIGDNCGFGYPGFTYSIGEIHKNKLIIIKGSPMKISDPLIDSYYSAREQAILKALTLI